MCIVCFAFIRSALLSEHFFMFGINKHVFRIKNVSSDQLRADKKGLNTQTPTHKCTLRTCWHKQNSSMCTNRHSRSQIQGPFMGGVGSVHSWPNIICSFTSPAVFQSLGTKPSRRTTHLGHFLQQRSCRQKPSQATAGRFKSWKEAVKITEPRYEVQHNKGADDSNKIKLLIAHCSQVYFGFQRRIK